MQFSNCIPVTGFNRTAIYDLQKNRYALTSNEFSAWLLKNEYKIPLAKDDLEITSQIKDLVNQEYGIYIDSLVALSFPTMDLSWDHPSVISNTQIDTYGDFENLTSLINTVFPQLEQLACKHYQINFLKQISYIDLVDFLIKLKKINIEYLNIFIPFVKFTASQIKNIRKICPQISSIFFYGSPKTIYNTNSKVFYTEDDICVRNKNKILIEYFSSNIPLFTESLKFNTYYNRKLSIDADGNIKNSPEHENNYGNVKNIKLKNVILKDEFKKLWYVHKEMIDVCKECEFRHMCVDGCAPLQRENGSWYRPVECDYNPYISKWKGESSYRTLAESGVFVLATHFEIEISELEKVINNVWS